ncbi:MAG: ERF family protein [Peptostreptococcaceae bacterium]|nr:ERF family protein [Peptostreptococcaceae bacterium]
MKIFEKIRKVQSELKAPKGQYNCFGKYKYRSCEDIVEAVKPLLSVEGLVLSLSDEIVLIGERYYIKATATLFDVEGESHSVSAFAREEESKKGMDGSQVTGASSSYARKYALNGLFAIDDTKDSDSTNTHGKNPEDEAKNGAMIAETEAAKIDKNKVNALTKLAKEKGVPVENIESGYGCPLADLTMAQWAQAMRNLEKREAKK